MIIRFLLLLSLCSITYAQEFKLQLSKHSCTPGEPVMLTATLLSEQVAEFDVTVPALPKLHLVNTQKSPITFSNGVFTQSQQWLIQPTHSGSISIEHFKATVTRGEQTSTLEAKPISLEVSEVTGVTKVDTAEPLPATILQQSTSPLGLTVLGCAVLGFIVYFITKKKQPNKTQGATGEPTPTLDSITEKLKSGTVPTHDIHHLLEHSTLGFQQREALEKAVYSKHCSANEILTELQKGAQS